MRHLLFFLSLAFCSSLSAQNNLRIDNKLEPVEIGQDHVSFEWSVNSDCNCELLAGKEKDDLKVISAQQNKRSFSATVGELKPSDLFYASLRCSNGRSSFTTDAMPFITASASTGKIKVYFNHQVNTSVSTGTNAVSLYGLVDDTLIAHINRATETLDIAIYNASTSSSISDIAAAINNAYSRGVKVRLIYEGGNTNSMIPNINSNIKRLASPTTFNYGIMHNKFVVIDAKSTNANKPLVWTGSTNWTVAQLNTDLNHVVTVQDKSLALAYRMEFEEMWGDTGLTPNASASKFGPFKTNNTPHNFNIGGVPVESYFSPSDEVNAQLISKIATATYDLNIACMVITRSDVASAITAQFNGGVGATHMVVDDSSGTTTWNTLVNGLGRNRVRSHNGITGIMHHKFMIVDATGPTSDPLVLTGSHNWSNSAEERNDENTLVIHDATIANQFYQAFTEIFSITGGVLSVKNEENNLEVSMYPVPVSDILQVDLKDASDFSVRITDLAGKLIRYEKVTGSRISLDLSALHSAAYLVTIETGAGEQNHYRILVSH